MINENNDQKKEPVIKAVRKKIGHDPNRYVMQNTHTGEIVDDAQGYGYKTPQKAYAAYNYKHRGGKKKHQVAAAYWRKHKEIKIFCEDLIEANAKDFVLGIYNLKDLQQTVKEEFNEDVPMDYLKKL